MLNTSVAAIISTISGLLEAGTRPWVKPWDGGTGLTGMPLRHNGVEFTGSNRFWLMLKNLEHSSPYWLTYKQAQELGGQVRKGEKSCHALLATTSVKEKPEASDGEMDVRRFYKTYPVFNADQIEDLPSNFYPTTIVANKTAHEITAEALALRQKLDRFPITRIVGNSAYYSPAQDLICLPPAADFHTLQDAFATELHELIHATGANHRTGRRQALKEKKWTSGETYYAYEELVAELGSIIASYWLGIPPNQSVMENHASYLASWSSLMTDRPTSFLTASHMAEQAAQYLMKTIGEAPANDDELIEEAA